VTDRKLTAQALGSFLSRETEGWFRSLHSDLTKLLPFAARLTLECIGNSDALYHDIEHTMLVTIRLEDAMSMSVESILRQKGADVATIVPEASVKRATSWLHAKNVGSLVVTSGNAVVGLISEREIVHAIARYGETATSMPVSEIMRRGVITVSPTDTVSHVMSLMTRHRVRHMPVLRDGNLVGIISIGDVVKHRLDDLELENKVLRDAYVVGR
jgi:predicted transcriptional regulator